MQRTQSSDFRWWDLLSAILIVVTLIVAATRLVTTRWTDFLPMSQSIAFIGVITGLAIGQSRFSPRVSFFFGSVYGLFFISWELLATIQGEFLWNQRLSIILGRLGIAIEQLITREPVRDTILFLLLINIIFWIVSAYAGYAITRHGNPWWAIIPAGLTVFVIHVFDSAVSQRAWYLAVFLFLAMVLVARMAYVHNKLIWQQSRSALPPQLGYDFMRVTLIIAIIILAFSWTIPVLAKDVPSISNAAQPIRETFAKIRERVGDLVAYLQPSVRVVRQPYGSSVSLGRGTPLSETQVMVVTPDDPIPLGARPYWRAKIYDSYADGVWNSTLGDERPYDPDGIPLSLPEDESRWLGSFDMVATVPIVSIYTPAQPASVSRTARLEAVDNPDGTIDLISLIADPVVTPGQSYSVESSLSTATVEQLRNAGEVYPDWITERYLEVPDSITPRTIELAEQITQGLTNPFDKAMAITTYLRLNITYADSVEAIPAGQEPIDWFLFDYKTGFCTYYATSQVIMLRSIGIPARYSVGYAQGVPQDNGSYSVRSKDSHAWPEVYFPGFGWIEFEPTAGQPILVRLAGEQNSTNENIGDELDELYRRQLEDNIRNAGDPESQAVAPAQPAGIDFRLILIPLAFSPIIILIAWLVWKYRPRLSDLKIPLLVETMFSRAGFTPPGFILRWARLASLPEYARSYQEVNFALKRMGNPPKSTQTPFERTASLIGIIPPAEDPAQTVLREYQTGAFSNKPADSVAAHQAGSKIRKLSYQARFLRWIAPLQGTKKSKKMLD